MDRSHLPRRVLPQHRSRENEDGEADPHEHTEVYRTDQPDEVELRHQDSDHVGEDEAPRELDDEPAGWHFRAGHRRDGVQAAEPHPRFVEQERTVPEPPQHEDSDRCCENG